jgi:hypothetical protein
MFSLDEARAILERTPESLNALLRGLPPAWLDATEGPETWSPRDVVAHLADLEDIDWPVRIRHILDGAPGTLPPVDRVRYRTTLNGVAIGELLDTFALRRRRNLAEADTLDLASALNRPATHPALGPVNMEQLLATWVVHDLTHVYQIVRVMAKRYDITVGPWKQYLSVLTR